MGTREIFRENLKHYRKAAGLTQEELSEKIGYGYTYITEIESRHKFPKPETIDLIAETLEIEPGKLFERQKNDGLSTTSIHTLQVKALLIEKIQKSVAEIITNQTF